MTTCNFCIFQLQHILWFANPFTSCKFHKGDMTKHNLAEDQYLHEMVLNVYNSQEQKFQDDSRVN